MTCRPIPLTIPAFTQLDRANRDDTHDWVKVCEWLQEGSAQVWSINDEGYVLTLANADDEIEVLMAGGENARKNVPVWEAAMIAFPAHKGKTLRIDGRKGWKRYLPHWEERDGVLYMKVSD